MTAAELVKALGGRAGMARCPAHDDRTPSLSVSDGRDGKLLVHCHAGCSQEAVWDALQRLGLVASRCRLGGDIASAPASTSFNLKEVDRLEAHHDRSADALAIWEASRSAQDTPAAEYLRCRGITRDPPGSIRYHEGLHALVAAVQASAGHIQGIQRVYLETDSRGTWATGKMSLGQIKGGAVRLTLPAAKIWLAESVEDGLALLQMAGEATWAVPGAGFMESFEPPPEVRKVIMAPDHDAAGLEAIEKAAAALDSKRVNPLQLLPPAEMDWCDVLNVVEERAALLESAGVDHNTAQQRAINEVYGR